MRQFFYPSSIAVLGVADNPQNPAKTIIWNCREMGFAGDIYPVGRELIPLTLMIFKQSLRIGRQVTGPRTL